MHKQITRLLARHCLLLSLLLHLLLFTSFTAVWLSPIKPPPKLPSMYVPSYAYQEPARTPSAPAPAPQKKEIQPKVAEAPQKAIAEKISIPDANKPNSVNETRIQQASKKSNQKSEAINLVGDKKVVPKPLIKLLARALSAHLNYPKIASDFSVKGTAYVGFSLHPDGQITDVSIVQSSKAGVLDDEAVTAVRAMSPLKNVSSLVDKKRFLVVGIIFN